MDVLTVGTRAAARLLAEIDPISRAITDALYAERPQLLDRYGENGRVRCLEDMRFNLEHLAPAVDMGEPSLFREYVLWLDDLLRARNVPTDDVIRSLELTEIEIRSRFAEDETLAILPSLRAGIEMLTDRD